MCLSPAHHHVNGISHTRWSPLYDDIANLSNPSLLDLDFDIFEGTQDGGWYEVASRNIPGLTAGWMCTHYNCSHTKGSNSWKEFFNVENTA